MSSHPRVTLVKVSYVWGEGGTSWTLPAGAILDVAPGSALEVAIGAGNLRVFVQGQDDWGGAALSN